MFRSLDARPPRQLDPPPHFGATGLHVHPQYRHGARLHRRWMGRPVPSLRCFSSTSLGCRSNCALLASDAPLRAVRPLPQLFELPPRHCAVGKAPVRHEIPVHTPIRPGGQGPSTVGISSTSTAVPLQAAVVRPQAMSLALLHVLARGGEELHCPGHCFHHLLSLSGPTYRSPTPARSHSRLTSPAGPTLP